MTSERGTWSVRHKTLLRLSLLSLLISATGWIAGCSRKDSAPQEEQVQKELKFDPSVLPASLRRSLNEAERRIKELEEQREIAETRLAKLKALSEEAGSESASALTQSERQLKTIETSIKRLQELVARIKLQAIATEGSAASTETDRELTSALEDAVAVYDELGELETTQREAAQGQAEAQFKLGKRYERGLGVDQSDAEALTWYIKAAEQDHIEAALISGFFYRKGRGGAKDLKQAKKWYLKAAELGNPTAASNLARILRAEKNLSEAVRWYRVAADEGVSRAQLELAQLYSSTDVSLEFNDQFKDPINRYIEAKRLLKSASKSRRKEIREQASTTLKELTERDAPKIATEAKKNMRWTVLKAGTLNMGDTNYPDAQPTHQVQLAQFSISTSEVTVHQYRQCVASGVCSQPVLDKSGCYYDSKHREYPINCITWEQARTFAHWVGGELPSEAQWEYAARSEGRHARYPWGDTEANCQRAVMRDSKKKGRKKPAKRGETGCGKGTAAPVCSKPQGLSLQGACDLVGNLWEWTLDEYRPSYEGAPNDGTARCDQPNCEATKGMMRSIRGGAYMSGTRGATATKRSQSDRAAVGIGFRVILTTP